MTALTAAQLDELEAYLIQYEKSNNLDPELITGQGTLDGVAYVRASVLRALLALGRASLAREMKPGRWWRVLLADGSLWCETSDEEEARAAFTAAPGRLPTIERQWYRSEEYEWRAA